MISNLRYNKKDENWIMAVLYELEFIFAYFQTQLMLGNAKYETKEAMETIVKCFYGSIIYIKWESKYNIIAFHLIIFFSKR